MMDNGVRSVSSGRHSMHIKVVKGRMGSNVAVGAIRTIILMMGYVIGSSLFCVSFGIQVLHRIIIS